MAYKALQRRSSISHTCSVLCLEFLSEEPPMTNHHYTESATPDMTKRYGSDLNDQEFALIAPHVTQKDGSGKKRTVDIRNGW